MGDEKNSQHISHDVHAELAKVKTSISLMKDASLEEIQKEYLPLITQAIEKLEKLLQQLKI